MAKITKTQYKALRKYVRAANRRIERASPGAQRTYEYFVEQLTGKKRWSSAAKGMSRTEAKQLIAQLKKFLSSPYTTITGWKKSKEKSVKNANRTLKRRGYHLTDDELADVLIQIDSKKKSDFYRAVNLVEAAKLENKRKAKEAKKKGQQMPNAWQGDSEEIAAVISQKIEDDEALEMALREQELARKKKK